MPEIKLVEGWTVPIDEVLRSNNTPVNLTGMTVALILQKANGTAVDTSGDVTVPDAPNGVVRYSPGAADLLAADTPHVARWKVTDGSGKIAYFPAAGVDVWKVLPAAAITLQDNALLTLDEVKAALNLEGNEADVSVARLVNEVSDAVESFFGRRLKTRTYTSEYLYVRPDRVLGCEWLDVEWPITALTTLEIDGTVQTIWMPGDAGSPEDKDVFVLEGSDPKHGRDRIWKLGGWSVGALVKRTYTAGYGVVGPPAFPIPGDLKECVRSLAVDWYHARTRQTEPVISRSTASETITYVNEALPRRFRALANAYRRWAA